VISCRLSVVSCLLVLLIACGRTAAPPPAPAAPPPAPVVAPEPLAQNFDEAKQLLAAGRLDLYEHSLQALGTSTDPQTSHRAMALLALFYIDQKRTEDAIPALTRAADAYKEVAPWLRLRVAELQSGAAHYPEAIAAANQIVGEAPATSAATVARLRLPAFYALAGDLPGTESSINQAVAAPVDELTEQDFVTLATNLEKAGRQDLATSLRMRLLTQYPQGRFTEQTYGLVQKGPPSPLDTLPIDDALALARKLGGENHYDEAIDLLGRIAQRSPDAAVSAEYRSVRLRSLFNSRHYPELLNETAHRKLDDPALILLRARAAWRADEPQIFLAGLKRIEKKYPKSSQAAEAKILRAKYYTVDDPKPQRAIQDLEKAIKAGGVGTEGENLWTLGWTYILAKRYDDALRMFERYGREFPDGDYMTNALFWSAKIHERLGHLDQRDLAFNALLASYPYSYYSYRAREIMKQPAAAPTEIPNGNAFPNVDAEIAALNEPRLDSVRELAWLALYREATAEMKAIAAAYPGSAGIAFQLADLYSVAGEPFKAVNVLQRRFRPFVRHGGSGVPHRFWEILFPLKYWESIRTEAQRRQIDPYLIASIIRQESGFEPSTVSNAGAVGIMQIMPQEAERIASAAGLQTPTRQQLFDPPTNIAIGVAEYAQKLAVMQGTAILAIAAYNAGEEAVGKWVAQTPVDDLDLFVESIPYGETRLYVKSVTRNRFEYRRIYEGVSSSS
jgi:soluble lytic murein transglycosylase